VSSLSIGSVVSERCTAEPGGIQPLLSAGRRVVVDGHAICAVCGGAVEPIGPDRWRHGRSQPPRITRAALRVAPVDHQPVAQARPVRQVDLFGERPVQGELAVKAH